MKRIAMTLAAAILICSAAVAQEEQQKKGPRPEKKFDKTEMVKHRTDETVKQYSLNEKQAAQLLELNTKYADKMGPGPRGPRHHRGGRPGMKPGQKPEQKPDAETGATPQEPKDGKKRPEMTEEQKAKMKAEREEMQQTMKAYDAELQKIMTPEQYKQYQADMEKRHQKGPRGHGPRQPRN